MKDYLNKDLLIRAIVAFIGCVAIAFGISLSGTIDMGMDPYSAMNMGISALTGIRFGTVVVIFNVFIFLAVVFVDRSQFGLGTIINWLFVGYIVEFFDFLFNQAGLGDGDMNLLIRVVLTVIAGTVFLFGAALYISAGIGTAPLDAIAPTVEEKSKFSYAQVRFAHEILCLLMALLLGGPVGLMTVYLGFFAGPMISTFRAKLAEPIVNKLTGSKI